MAKTDSICFAILFLAFTLTGCGNVQSVHAATPSPTPAAVVAVPSTCNSSACSGLVNTQWGYCQYETHRYTSTFSVSLEIGVNANVTDPSTSNCFVPIPGGTANVTGIHGTLNYLPWTANVSSMALRINANGDGCNCGENTFYAAKLTAHSAPVSVPIDVTPIVPISVINGANGPGTFFVVLFNDDLGPAKPTTINVAFSGNIQ